jgi:Glycosyltransferase like family 2
VDAPVKRSAYAARNIGAELTGAPWLLFLDADCLPEPGLIDAYFDPLPGERAGAVAGAVAPLASQPGLAPRYARTRRHLDQEWLLTRHPYRPMAVTANLLVRRAAWEQLGGFQEMTRSGADADLCWRLQDAGWTIEHRPGARAEHEHRATVRALLAQAARDGAGHRWLSRRSPGLRATIPLRRMARSAAGWAAFMARRRPGRGLVNALDVAWIAAWNLGTLQDNCPPLATHPARTVILLEEFPRAGDPRLASLGPETRVEALRRPVRPDWRAGRGLNARLWEDEGPWTRARAAGALGPRRAALALAPAARRLAADQRGVTLLAEAGLMETARRLTELSGRRDIEPGPLPTGSVECRVVPRRAQ